MAQLCYSNSRKYRYRSDDDFYESNQLEETKKLEIVKRYVAKQLNSALNLEHCLKNRKKFTSSDTQEDVSQYATSGLASLSDFKNVCNSENIKVALKGCHLNENEIEFLLHDSVKKNEHSDAYLQKLKSINEKLLLRQNCLAETDTSTNQSEIEVYPPIPKNHPINFLQQLEAQLFPQLVKEKEGLGYNENPPLRKRRKRNNKSDGVLNHSSSVKDNTIECNKDNHIVGKKTTYWDVKEVGIKPLPKNDVNHIHNAEDTVGNYSPSKGNKLSKEKLIVTVKKEALTPPNFAKPFVWTMDKSKLTPLSVIEQNKIDIDIMKKNVKFKNYNCGVPSTTLYLKNLPRVMDPEKIVSIFGNFEEVKGSKIEYRILDGRMKGQAFVKFSSIKISTLALSTCNGYILDDKPIIIEYGRL